MKDRDEYVVIAPWPLSRSTFTDLEAAKDYFEEFRKFQDYGMGDEVYLVKETVKVLGIIKLPKEPK